MTSLIAFILSCGGRVVGRTADGEYITEPVSPEEVEAKMPPGFINETTDPGRTVFDEVLMVSTIWNPEVVERELKEQGELREEETKNLMNSFLMNATLSSESEASNPQSENTE